jgi:predicted flap endonuclease-1-like 5' DNA nuclease
MSPEFLAALPIILLGLALILFAIWLAARPARKTTIVDDESSQAGGDVLDEGGAKATRNQALIDAPTAVRQDFGQTSANANSNRIAAASIEAVEDAGVGVAPTVGDPVPPRPEAGEKAKSAAQQADTSVAPAANTPDASASTASGGDDLTQMKGVGPKLAAMLNDLGVHRFEQIAAWTDEDIIRVDGQLGRFRGRITRDHWVEQAALLNSNDKSAFAEKFGQYE